MAFKPGQSGNPTGRPRGAVNKVDVELREMIGQFLKKEFETVEQKFHELDPKDQLKFYTDLLGYGIPKLSSTTLDIDYDSLSEEQLDEIINRLLEKSNNDEK